MVAALFLFYGLNLVPGTLWILQSFMWDMEGQDSGSILTAGEFPSCSWPQEQFTLWPCEA